MKHYTLALLDGEIAKHRQKLQFFKVVSAIWLFTVTVWIATAIVAYNRFNERSIFTWYFAVAVINTIIFGVYVWLATETALKLHMWRIRREMLVNGSQPPEG